MTTTQISSIHRRAFLKSTVVAGSAIAFPMVLPRRVFGANERLNIAAIGSGGKGQVDIDGCESQNIVALCDVDPSKAAHMFKRHAKAPKYADFREMLDKEAKHIDAVTVSTPDHTHATATAMAIRLGKHVYCQKPLTHSVYEARVLTDLARNHKVATQMGNQGHSNPDSRRYVELIRAGVLGDVKEVHIWTDRPVWPQGIGRPAGAHSAPKDVSWDLWLGPAPERPYHPAYHPFKWRGFWDFGTGAVGDMGCHNSDLAYWALNLRNPTTLEAVSSGINSETAPKWSIITYYFPQDGKRKPVKVVWYDGGKKPDPALAKQTSLPGNGSILIGSKDSLYIPMYWGKGSFLSGATENDHKDVPEIFEKPKDFNRHHYLEWIEACKGGKPAWSNFDYSGPMTEAMLLGLVALRSGRKIKWDAKKMHVTNFPDANELINPEYRKGWLL